MNPGLEDIINQVATGLAKQRSRSMNPKGAGCNYRGSGGNKCAFGFLIPDQAYQADMEGLTAAGLIKAPEIYPGLVSLVQDWVTATQLRVEQLHRLFNGIQAFHDESYPGNYGDMLVRYVESSDECLADTIKTELTRRVSAILSPQSEEEDEPLT